MTEQPPGPDATPDGGGNAPYGRRLVHRIMGPRQPELRRLLLGALPGAVAAVAAVPFVTVPALLLIGWDTTAACYLLLVWLGLRGLDAEATARIAVREDPSRPVADTLVLVAAVVSIAAVGALIASPDDADDTRRLLQVALGVVSIALSWAVVHVVFLLGYARRYYEGAPGGIDFGEAAPAYGDFAYLAFTIGMTYQVSDTTLQTRELRSVALRHALLSFVFGTLIIATTINLVAGLAR